MRRDRGGALAMLYHVSLPMALTVACSSVSPTSSQLEARFVATACTLMYFVTR